jgi:pyridoxine 5-phosphate synthase
MRPLCAALDGMATAGDPSRMTARLVTGATLADLAGVGRVRVTVREELAPIGAAELRDLRRVAQRLELRIAPLPSLVKVALEARPDRVLLAGDGSEGRSTPPLDLPAWSASLPGALRTLREAGIEVALAIAPTLEAVKAARAADAGSVELSTAGLVDLPLREREEAQAGLGDAARLGAKLRMSVGVGGALTLANIAPLLEAAPSLEWVASGRGFVERALLVGIERAVRDWREVI